MAGSLAKSLPKSLAETLGETFGATLGDTFRVRVSQSVLPGVSDRIICMTLGEILSETRFLMRVPMNQQPQKIMTFDLNKCFKMHLVELM